MALRVSRLACTYLAVAVLVATLPGVSLPAATPPHIPSATIATVNDVSLPRAIFDRAFLKLAEETVRFGPGIPLYRMWSYRLQALSEAVDEQLIANEARAHNISVPESVLNTALDDMAGDYLAQLAAREGDLEANLAQACSALGGPDQPTMTEADFRVWLRDWLRPRYADDLTAALTADSLKAKVTPLPDLTEADIRAQFATLTLRTIAIRRRPAERLEQAEREVEERAQDILQQIQAGADFAALAAATDDTRYSATGGLEPETLISSLNPDRQRALAPRQIGDVSGLIKTDAGYEIIRVEQRGHRLPFDYEETRPQLRARLAAERQEQAWQAHVKAMHDAASVTVTDPELLAYAALADGKEDDAIPLLEAASQHPDILGPAGASCVSFRLAVAYSARNRWEEATRAYAACNTHIQPVTRLFPDAQAAILLGLGHTYENLGLQLRPQHPDRAEAAIVKALQHYQEASRSTANPSHHDRIRLAYKRLGRSDLAQHEEAWLTRYRSDIEARRKSFQDGRQPSTGDPAPH